MNRRMLGVVAVVAVVLVVGLVWLVQRAPGGGARVAAAGDAGASHAPGPGPGPGAPSATSVRAAGAGEPGAPDATPAPPPAALDRDLEVRTKIDAVLDKYPDVAKLKTLECQPTGACTVEIHVDDLHNFRAPMELLQDPESGLSGDHALMILSQPVALGPKGTAPFLFTFQLTPPEGGVVKP